MMRRLAFGVALSALTAAIAQANPEGAPAGHTGGLGQPDCSACHDLGAEPTEHSGLFLEGLSDTFEAGREYTFELTVIDPAARVAGFQLMLVSGDGEHGQWLPGEGQAVMEQSDSVYVHHSQPRMTQEDGKSGERRAQWMLRWRAPEAEGALAIYAAAVAGDDDQSPFGDNVYTVTKKGRIERPVP